MIRRVMNRGATGPATLLLLVVLSTPAPAHAIEVNAFEVARNGETYRLHSDVKLGAEPEKVRRLLHQFES
ncbi:MAG: hypothetical protein GWO02_20995, partial [Gammaproteobacteria bacterium]|nr:hypothetical protein [Gammaproteobacteria bacterium]